MTFASEDLPAAEIAAAVKSGEASAREFVNAALARIEARNSALGAFTDVTATRALAKADAIDSARAKGEALGPLAGAPFAAKNLFDIAGLPTRAGSKINRDLPPAGADATLVQRLEAAGAILVGGLNMGEYAYDFTGENAHDGPSRNPHDVNHMSGGSSGGSGTAIASGMVPLALGSDTNGSIRVPSSLCGIFGLKPTYGRLSRARTFPFVASFDHLGPFARSVRDLALAYDAMLGPDADDPALADVAPNPVSASLEQGVGGLRIAALGGYFARTGEPAAFEAVARVARALGAARVVDLPQAERARASGYLITMAEGAALHLDRLRTRAADFDPDVRDRLIAGAMLPAAWIVKAQKFRSWFRHQVAEVFKGVDIVLAPATPCRAPLLGQRTMMLDGQEMLVRPNLGLFTQPISFIGLPVATVPVWTDGEKLPIGVQIIAAPWREDLVLRVARALEAQGIVSAPIAKAR
ncbi:AtzE family amidohydrolase [Methylocapsa sp. S129]|uniref:AtzE family amidohydrolase n=1 Tax=Methylocapsa sp. S129 TaxID=1641869 RepID=UPI00131E5CC1|nr:AtzE family amidohydrolase [Methylocapsa sp. S129]